MRGIYWASKQVRRQARPQTSTLKKPLVIQLLTQLGLRYTGIMCISFKCIYTNIHRSGVHAPFSPSPVHYWPRNGQVHERSRSVPLLVSRSRCSSGVKLFFSSCQGHLFINQRYSELCNDKGKGGSVELTKD